MEIQSAAKKVLFKDRSPDEPTKTLAADMVAASDPMRKPDTTVTPTPPAPRREVPVSKLITPAEAIALLGDAAAEVETIDAKTAEIAEQQRLVSQDYLSHQKHEAQDRYHHDPTPENLQRMTEAVARHADLRSLKLSPIKSALASAARHHHAEHVEPTARKLFSPILSKLRVVVGDVIEVEKSNAAKYGIDWEPSVTVKAMQTAVAIFTASVSNPSPGQSIGNLLRRLGVEVKAGKFVE